ncbi:hypothetical protein HU200_002346 [Digitaria exilis]|uniref:Ricin B lectin domain-containing protein n=1 Tax=Digitaria exilis TaxID=1010633 RepID=A0A835FWW0_9POAL|nr:hypothetical protein HU200_002346 [Digitaria exilis]
MASTFSIHCRASDDLLLAMVDGEPVLTKADTIDDRQLWLKDLRYGAGLTDEEGSPAFALVNKATGEALKHSFGHNCPVRAIKFYPLGYVDESILWAEDKDDMGDGFRRIHMINNMDYIFDAEQGIPDYGGAREGTRLILFRWNGGQNQQWRITRTRTVRLVPHKPDSVDVALLWTQGNDRGEGFRNLRSVSDTDIVLDAANGGEAGGAHDGTAVIIFPWNRGANQKWKMIPFQ